MFLYFYLTNKILLLLLLLLLLKVRKSCANGDSVTLEFIRSTTRTTTDAAGLKMNIANTKVMVVENTPININNVLIQNVEGYVYVGQCYNLKENNQYKEIPTEDRDNTDE